MVLMHTLSLDSSFKYIMWVRVYQASGLAFLFIPINTISYAGVQRSENNDVSGLTNLARNIGGSVGTAFVATTLARAGQRHENYLAEHASAADQTFQNSVNALKNSFHGGGMGPTGGFGGGRGVGGIQSAQAFLYNQMHRQASMLAYLDIVSFLAVFCVCMIPLAFAIGKIKPAADGPAMH